MPIRLDILIPCAQQRKGVLSNSSAAVILQALAAGMHVKPFKFTCMPLVWGLHQPCLLRRRARPRLCCGYRCSPMTPRVWSVCNSPSSQVNVICRSSAPTSGESQPRLQWGRGQAARHILPPTFTLRLQRRVCKDMDSSAASNICCLVVGKGGRGWRHKCLPLTTEARPAHSGQAVELAFSDSSS